MTTLVPDKTSIADSSVFVDVTVIVSRAIGASRGAAGGGAAVCAWAEPRERSETPIRRPERHDRMGRREIITSSARQGATSKGWLAGGELAG
ncbi:hypothetical protein [Methylobacterium oryzihabitans]|uniref:hypothetical protein n=1 Tax=Methylobacterium oryzihabitans TaxID=2499852 RepID=UPI001FE3BFF9|nr:hypothetical protein [Methylobacterium oryzihabitans]